MRLTLGRLAFSQRHGVLRPQNCAEGIATRTGGNALCMGGPLSVNYGVGLRDNGGHGGVYPSPGETIMTMKRKKNAAVISTLLAACVLGTLPRAAHAAMHYWPLAKEARAGNTQAAQQIMLAARAGHRGAQLYAGLLYYYGWGVPQNTAKADAWYEKAAAQGDAPAEFNLGVNYYHGWGVPQNTAQANYWYEKAAAQGYAAAEYNLGVVYQYGQGVPQNYTQADAWYEKAAAQGDADAEDNLGLAYYHGQGVPQNSMEAAALWRKAAAQGDSYARHNLEIIETGSAG